MRAAVVKAAAFPGVMDRFEITLYDGRVFTVLTETATIDGEQAPDAWNLIRWFVANPKVGVEITGDAESAAARKVAFRSFRAVQRASR